MNFFRNYILKECRLTILPIIAMIVCICIDSSYPYLQKIFVDDIILGNEQKYLFGFLTIFAVLAFTQGIF